MRRSITIGVLFVAIAGCQGDPGHGPRASSAVEVKSGGVARLVSSDGSDVILDRIVDPAPGKTGRRSPRTGKVEKLKLPAGTTVLVQDIIGDDANVVIKDGSSAGSTCWVERIRLEPLAR